MEEQRYYIAIDENGEAYIEHGLFDRARSTGQRAHKYLMKIGEGAKARYLYTQEEVRAYMQGGQKRNPNIKRPEDFEIRARRPDSAPNKMQQTKSSGIKRPEDFEIRARRPENVSSKTAEKTGQAVKDTVKKVVETVKDKAGVDERQRAEEAWSKVPKQLSSKDEKGMQAFKEANKAQDEYRKTPLGKAEYLTERAQEIATGVDGSAKDIAKKVGSTVKSKTDRMKEEFRKKKDEVRNAKLPDLGIAEAGIAARKNLKEAEREYESAKRSGERLQNRASEKMSERGRSAPVQDTQLYKKGADMQKYAQKDLENAQKRYDRSLLGRAENAVKDTAKKAVDKAKDIAGVDERERLRNAERDYRDARVESQAKEKARQKAQENKTDFTDEEYSRKSEEASQARKNEKEASDNLGKAKRDYDKTALGVLDRIKPESKSNDVAETARTNGEKGQEQKKLESSRKEAENATKREDELFANLNRLAGEYEQKYGDNWKNRLSEDEERAYKIAENRFDGSLRMSKEKWDSYSKQVQDFERKWNTKK